MSDTLDVVVAQSPAELVGPQERLNWLESALGSVSTKPADLIVLPELFLTGYNVGDQIAEWAIGRDSALFQRITGMAKAGGLAIHFSYAELDGQDVFNAAACIDKHGRLIGSHRKLLLPPGFEGNHFSGGSACQTFRLGDFTVATLICYDAEFPENFRQVSDAELVLVPTALAVQWEVVAHRVIPARAFENGVYVCYANHCGHENGIDYLGSSCIVGPDGKDMARAGAKEELIFGHLKRDRVTAARQRLPYHVDRLKLPWVGATDP